jgi:insertion element IS1 protein InsB
MLCKYCQHPCLKSGRQKNNVQRFYCRGCRKYQQSSYTYKACHSEADQKICTYVKESCGIRSISRIMRISATTVIRRIRKIARDTAKPYQVKGKEYEMDEMRTYIRNKQNKYWIAYAIRKDTREVADFKVGRRNTSTLKRVTDTLMLSEASKVYTDKLNIYQYIIPRECHHRNKYKINHIERKNLSVRTHLKRLGRKTICFSKSISMLEACLKIYFWYSPLAQTE